MKTLFTIVATVFLICSARAESSFLDDAPKGFVHSREATGSAIADSFIRTTKIVSVEVVTLDEEQKQGSTVMVRTTGRKGNNGLAYHIKFEDRAEALKCANRIMALTTADD